MSDAGNVDSSSSTGGVDIGITTGFNVSNTTTSNASAMSPEEYTKYLESYIFPTAGEWVIIFLYVCTFFIGLIGNSLVCFAIIRNKNMRTTTNLFIMNLSVADLAVILICLPLSLVYDVTSTWFFGTIACCIYSFLNTFSINVSVLTLSAISVERWYAICHPLRFHGTIGRTKLIILFIWIASICASLPITLTSSSSRHRSYTVYFANCYPSMMSGEWLLVYQLCFIIGLYVLPLGLMGFAYVRIALVLWKDEVPGQNVSRSRQPMLNSDKKQPENDAHSESRKKAARMLIAVVVVFAICYLPNHMLNILIFTGITNDESMRETILISAMIAHWLVTFNSCINPIIYNFMSGKFRKEFKDAIYACCSCCKRRNMTWSDSYRVTFNAANYRTMRTGIGNSCNESNKAPESTKHVVVEQM